MARTFRLWLFAIVRGIRYYSPDLAAGFLIDQFLGVSPSWGIKTPTRSVILSTLCVILGYLPADVEAGLRPAQPGADGERSSAQPPSPRPDRQTLHVSEPARDGVLPTRRQYKLVGRHPRRITAWYAPNVNPRHGQPGNEQIGGSLAFFLTFSITQRDPFRQNLADSPVVGPIHRPRTCLAPSQSMPIAR
jgi:hypothetical protein